MFLPRRALAALTLTVGAMACDASKPLPAWHQETGYRWRDVDVPSGNAGFSRMEKRTTGIDFENTVDDSVLLGNRILGQGAGVSLGDVDGDGLVDVFLARTQGCSALYKNLGNWKFQDVTTTAGVGACDRFSTGTALADFDGDGDLDLILLATRGPNAIFVNDGHGVFTERRDLGLDPNGNGGTTVTMADVDGSGRLAMYIANYRAYNLDDSIPPQRRAFNQMVREVSKGKFEIVPEWQNEYKLTQRPDMGGLRMSVRGATDQFYRNEGGRFTQLPMAGNFLDAAGKPLENTEESFALDAKFADLNGDGAPDLYVTNDFEDIDQLFFNDGRGGFRLAPWTAQRQVSNSSMGMDVADINGDGYPDIFIDDMLSNDSRRLQTQIPTHTPLPKKPGEMELTLQQQRNVLFLNRGDGTFGEISELAGVQASGWSWGTMFMDVDLDGRQDILIANGHLWDIMDADTQEGLQNSLNDVNWRRLRWKFPPLKLKNVAYRNRGDLTFEDVSEKWRFGTEEDISHTLASADLDGDGDLDVVVNRLRAPALIMRNDASAPRVAVRLVGDAPNTMAVGAKITLLGGAVPKQQREVSVGGLYMSHSDYEASFAMGTADSATLVVDWRDGKRTTMPVHKNRLYEITQKTAAQRAARDSSRHAAAPALFEDASAQLRGHMHVEDAFDDWDRQFLLPNALSQLGPGVSWFDIDRDGSEDLIIGAGKGGALSVFRNTRGVLAPMQKGPIAPADFTTVLGMADAQGTRLIAGISTWQARTPAEMTDQPAVVSIAATRGGVGAKLDPVVGSHESATGPIALADYDGDGDLDLFVGSRAIPMRYPVAASSGFFRNDAGKFVTDNDNMPLGHNVGLVSAAVFADMNGDGYPDLLVAREWGSILLFLNNGHGRFSPAPASWGLERWTSRWNGITVGDLDGDGRLDIVATSWGRNTATPADSAHPLLLYHGIFGAAGEEEMLLARDDARIKGAAPLNSYARVRVAFPELVGRIRGFASYADATAEQILGPSMDRVEKLAASTLDHMVFLNRGDHFVPAPLPAEAQFAPAFYAGIADFDGDGAEDLFLSENFSPTAIGTQRYDGGRGLLMRGDGNGGLTPVSGADAGITVYGDQRGAAFSDYDGDGRLDLVVSQNGAATRLFHNRGAKPGLRVRVHGPASNPDAVGAQVRVVYGARMGPVREISAGAGYWSQNGATQVMGLSGAPTEVWVRWPGGGETRVPVPAKANEITVTRRAP